MDRAAVGLCWVLNPSRGGGGLDRMSGSRGRCHTVSLRRSCRRESGEFSRLVVSTFYSTWYDLAVDVVRAVSELIQRRVGNKTFLRSLDDGGRNEVCLSFVLFNTLQIVGLASHTVSVRSRERGIQDSGANEGG